MHPNFIDDDLGKSIIQATVDPRLFKQASRTAGTLTVQDV